MSHTQTLTLFHDWPSICAQMVRFTWALRNRDAERAVMNLQRVALFKNETYTEDYMTNINWKAQVPVLRHDDIKKLIPETTHITDYLVELHPELKGPAEHQQEIRDLMYKLHEINYFTLSFSDRPHMSQGTLQTITKLRENPSNSNEFNDILDRKMTLLHEEKIRSFEGPSPEQNENLARTLMEKLAGILLATNTNKSQPGSISWLYGAQQPTMLDAHLIIFLQRLSDVGRLEELAPAPLQEYLKWVRDECTEYKEMMGGLGSMVSPADADKMPLFCKAY